MSGQPSGHLPLRPSRTPARSLSELAARLGAVAVDDVELHGITHDSRAVRPADLYAALPGTHVHGARFAADAVGRGAVAALTDPAGVPDCAAAGLPTLVVDEPRHVLGAAAAFVYGEPTRSLQMLGVTGTNGKTTTSYYVEAGLRAAEHRTGLVGTVETRIANETIASVRTTPEATDLQSLFALMVERGVDAVAMEVSSHALALHRVDGIRFAVAAFTNLSAEHLDFHRDLEDYFTAKARLFTPGLSAQAVVNLDDPFGERLTSSVAIPVTSYSLAGDPRADWRAADVQVARTGSRFTAHGPSEQLVEVETLLPGRFNTINALAALVTLSVAGVDSQIAARGIAALEGVPGRLERVDAGQPFLALVDYAHTPRAVEALLTDLRPLTRGRLIVVLGCGGDRDRLKRPLMGAAAVRGADVAVFTSDNPRSEDSLAILAEMERGVDDVPVEQRSELLVEPDRAAAITLAVRLARPADTVVVAGKGHEQGQEFADRTVPFDDRVSLRSAIEAAHVASGDR